MPISWDLPLIVESWILFSIKDLVTVQNIVIAIPLLFILHNFLFTVLLWELLPFYLFVHYLPVSISASWMSINTSAYQVCIMVIEKQWVTEISLFKMYCVFKFIVFYKFTVLVITYEKSKSNLKCVSYLWCCNWDGCECLCCAVSPVAELDSLSSYHSLVTV